LTLRIVREHRSSVAMGFYVSWHHSSVSQLDAQPFNGEVSGIAYASLYDLGLHDIDLLINEWISTR
jgi:hypothetical protein